MRETLNNTLQRLAKDDRRIVFVGSDLSHNTLSAMAEFRAAFPERFLMEGIAEQYMIGMAAGLASGGLIPYVFSIAPFTTRRAFEQLYVDIGLQELRVRIIGFGAGLAFSQFGRTHTALEDVALLRQVPNMGICIPRTREEFEYLLVSTVEWDGPLYIRLSSEFREDHRGPIGEFGQACTLRRGKGALMVCTGVMSSAISEIWDLLVEGGLNPEMLHFSTLVPFDSHSLCEAAQRASQIIVIEEHDRNGGLGSMVLETLADAKILRSTTRLGAKFEPTRRYSDDLEANNVNFSLRGSALAEAILTACVRDEEVTE